MEIPEITLYDTLSKRGRHYAVIGEAEDYFIIKEIDFQFIAPIGGGKRTKLSKAYYYSGKSGFRRLDLPRVKVSYIKS